MKKLFPISCALALAASLSLSAWASPFDETEVSQNYSVSNSSPVSSARPLRSNAPAFAENMFEQTDYDGAVEDILIECMNAIKALKAAQKEAIEATQFGDFQGAVATLLRGLGVVTQPGYFAYRSEPAPHTQMAIQSVKSLVESLASASTRLPPLRKFQATYIVIDDLYDLIIDAYNNLDAKWYPKFDRRCRHPEEGCRTAKLPREYYNGVARLGHALLVSTQSVFDILPRWDIRLKITSDTLAESEKILVNYIHASKMCEAFEAIEDLKAKIATYLPNQDDSQQNPGTQPVVIPVQGRLQSVKRDYQQVIDLVARGYAPKSCSDYQRTPILNGIRNGQVDPLNENDSRVPLAEEKPWYEKAWDSLTDTVSDWIH